MDLRTEIEKRLKEDNVNYETIGAEIKRHRLAMSKTLSSIADEDCSISYLCKIERNQVKPSLKYLNEICKKVNISKENIDYLLSSKELLIEAVKIFYFKDLEQKDKYTAKLEGLDNYRTEIIRLIFNLTENNIQEAGKCVDKIWSLISSLADFDLMIFAGFYGVYKYMTKEYIEASDYLKLALDFNIEVNYFRVILLMYLFKICYKIGSYRIYKYYKLLENERIQYGENLDLDQIYYYLSLFYLLEDNKKEYDASLLKINNKKYTYNLNILEKLINKEEDISANIYDLNDFVKTYYLIYKDSPNVLEEIDNANIDSDEKVHFKYIYLKAHNLEEAYEFLISIAFPYAIVKGLYSKARYYLDEMSNSIHRPNKYKRFFDMYRELERLYVMTKYI